MVALMCYDDESAPPVPPVSLGHATGTELVLTAADGTRFAAYQATLDNPADRKPARIVVLPDVSGLYDFYRQLAVRFAETGHTTVVIDYFGRTVGPGPRSADFDNDDHLPHLTREQIITDLRAAVDHVRTESDGPIYTVGFCLGGGMSLYAGTAGLGLTGVVAFYAWTGGWGSNEDLPHDFVRDITCPVLGLFGADDKAVPEEVPLAFRQHLAESQTPHDIVIYPGQGHGFFEKDYKGEPGHERAAAEAWDRLLAFLAVPETVAA
jgi:carboxymethylenebutenolidase